MDIKINDGIRKKWIFIPFTKVVIVWHGSGSRLKITFNRFKNPFNVWMLRFGRIVFYSNYNIIPFIIDKQKEYECRA